MAHEIGHRMISEHFYGDADTIAASIAHDFLGKRCTATAASTADASRAACDNAAREIVGKYMDQVRDPAEVVQEAYDRITHHGTAAIDEMDAIKQAIAESEKSALR
jgi:ATP-dependent protease HslVU (ClpYQ) ATPase subunit